VRIRVAILILFAVFASQTNLCSGQGTMMSSGSENEAVMEADIDLAVPESPAFAVLGLTAQSVVRPSSPRELALSILDGVDAQGNLQAGVAIDVVPYLLAFGDELTLREYREDYKERLLSRGQVSLSTAKGTSDDDKAIRVAFGFRWTIWDEGDPRMDRQLTADFDEKLVLPELSSNLTLDEREEKLRQMLPEYERALEKEAERCREDSRRRNWNNSAWDIGFAPSWISEDGTTDDLEWNGLAVWSSLAYGFEGIKGLEDRAQIIFHARYRRGEEVPDANMQDTFFEQDSVLVGGRLRFGSPSLSFSVEGVFSHAEPEDWDEDDSLRVSGGVEVRVAENLWLEVSVGGSDGRNDDNDQGFVLAQLKWGFSRESKLAENFLVRSAGMQ